MATWDPFDRVDLLRREIDRAFDRLGPQFAPAFRAAFLPGRGAREYPLVNIYQQQDALIVEALAPGADPESLNVSVTGNTMTITGEKRRVKTDVAPEAFHREERAAGKFIRTIELPVDIDDGKVKAEYKNGLLLITLPKAQKAKPRQIDVQVA
jgi:HSP20 family protein